VSGLVTLTNLVKLGGSFFLISSWRRLGNPGIYIFKGVWWSLSNIVFVLVGAKEIIERAKKKQKPTVEVPPIKNMWSSNSGRTSESQSITACTTICNSTTFISF